MAEQGWVNQIGAYRVEKKEGPRPGGAAYLKLRPGTPAFCIHTTEGSTVDGAVSTIRSRFTAPHFVVGQNRIVQMRPLWAQGATVHDWNDRYIQVECVGFSKLAEHQLTPDTWKPLVALTRWLHEQLGIPLRRPDGWADQLPAGTWANNNTRRQSRIALTFKGLVGHIDIPDQDPSWHWDPGSLDYSALIAEAGKGEEDEMTDEERKKLNDTRKDVDAILNGVADFIQGTPPGDDAKAPRKHVYKALQKAARLPENLA